MESVSVAPLILCPSCKHVATKNLEGYGECPFIRQCVNCKENFAGIICKTRGHVSATLAMLPKLCDSFRCLCRFPGCTNIAIIDKCKNCKKDFKNQEHDLCPRCSNKYNFSNAYMGFQNKQAANLEILSSLIFKIVRTENAIVLKKVEAVEKQQIEILKKLDELREIVTWMPGLKAATETGESFEKKVKGQVE